MTKTESVEKLLQSGINEIYTDQNKLAKFLKFSAGIYKYSFDDALIIYKTNTEATMLAEINIWNKVGRRVGFGEKGIPVFTDSSHTKVRYLYDVSQTNGSNETVPKLWKLTEENSLDFFAGSSQSIDEYISSETTEAVNNCSEQLNEIIVQNNLTPSQADEIYKSSEQIVRNTVCGRCTLNSSINLEQKELNISEVTGILDKQSFVKYCRINNSAAKTVLKSIEKTMLEINMKRGNDNDRNNAKNQNSQRRAIYPGRGDNEILSKESNREQHRVHTGREGLSVLPEPEAYGRSERRGNTESATGQVRQTVEEMDGGERSALHQSMPLQADGSSGGQRVLRESGQPKRTIQTEQSPSDNIYGNTSLGKGTSDVDRPHSNDGISLQSERDGQLLDNTKGTVSNDTVPFFDAPSSSEQLSFISEPESISEDDKQINKILESGTLKVQGKERIISYYNNYRPDNQEFSDFLKKEYGICGYYGSDYKVTYNGRGVLIGLNDDNYPNNIKEIRLNWKQTAERISQLIESGEYAVHEPKAIDKPKSITPKNSAPSEEKTEVKEPVNTLSSPEITGTKIDYVYDPNNTVTGGQKTRYKNNVEAVKLLKQLEAENRYASSEEQNILAKYIGWGGIPQAFDNNNYSWSKEYAELKELLTDEEYASARASTLSSFYTPPEVIVSIHSALSKFDLPAETFLNLHAEQAASLLKCLSI